MSAFDFNFVKRIHKEIIDNGMIVPKNLSWIRLLPGNYIISDFIYPIKDVTFLHLMKSGLLMGVYYHPDDESNLVLLSSLQKKFMFARCIGDNLFILDDKKCVHFNKPLKEIENNELISSFKF